MSSPSYLTREGLKKTKTDIEALRKQLREIADRIEKAKEMGDLSENAAYQEAKEDYAFAKGKILELEDILNRAVVIQNVQGSDTVQIGSTVTVSSGKNEKSYTIVGPSEANPTRAFISNESPLGQAFLGKRVGERVEVKVPAGTVEYEIVRIA